MFPKLRRQKDDVILEFNGVNIVTGYLIDKKKIILSLDKLTCYDFNNIRLSIQQALEIILKTNELLLNNYVARLTGIHNIISNGIANDEDTFDSVFIMNLLNLSQDDLNRLCLSGELVRIEDVNYVNLRLTKRSVNRYVTRLISK